MIFLVCLNPFGFPVRCSLLGRNSAYFPHGGEVHTFSSMLGFPSCHVVGNTNVDKFVPIIALILVHVSCFGHLANTIYVITRLSQIRFSCGQQSKEWSCPLYYVARNNRPFIGPNIWCWK